MACAGLRGPPIRATVDTTAEPVSRRAAKQAQLEGPHVHSAHQLLRSSGAHNDRLHLAAPPLLHRDPLGSDTCDHLLSRASPSRALAAGPEQPGCLPHSPAVHLHRDHSSNGHSGLAGSGRHQHLSADRQQRDRPQCLCNKTSGSTAGTCRQLAPLTADRWICRVARTDLCGADGSRPVDCKQCPQCRAKHASVFHRHRHHALPPVLSIQGRRSDWQCDPADDTAQ